MQQRLFKNHGMFKSQKSQPQKTPNVEFLTNIRINVSQLKQDNSYVPLGTRMCKLNRRDIFEQIKLRQQQGKNEHKILKFRSTMLDQKVAAEERGMQTVDSNNLAIENKVRRPKTQ